MLLYLVLKWVHVVTAVVVVGAHFSYGFWIVRGSNHPEALPFVLRNIKWFDDRVVGPAIALLLLAGFGMGFVLPSVFRAPWLIIGMILFVILIVVHMASYRPTLVRMIRLLESEGPNSAALQAAGTREKRVGISLIILMAVIIYLMVVKPTLW